MKKALLNSLLILTFIYTSAANAALYRGVDAEGNVVYSDTPFEDAEKFTPPPISVVDTAKVKLDEKAVKDDKAAEFKYMSFDILSPKNNETIQNSSDVTVLLKLKPGLNPEKEHTIWLLVDGKPVVKNTRSLSLQLTKLDRGAHELQAQIRNEKGKIIVRTRTSIIFIHRASIN